MNEMEIMSLMGDIMDDAFAEVAEKLDGNPKFEAQDNELTAWLEGVFPDIAEQNAAYQRILDYTMVHARAYFEIGLHMGLYEGMKNAV